MNPSEREFYAVWGMVQAEFNTAMVSRCQSLQAIIQQIGGIWT